MPSPTLSQIAECAPVSLRTVQARHAKGLRGAELIAPAQNGKRKSDREGSPQMWKEREERSRVRRNKEREKRARMVAEIDSLPQWGAA